jgi:hypothetical protein
MELQAKVHYRVVVSPRAAVLFWLRGGFHEQHHLHRRVSSGRRGCPVVPRICVSSKTDFIPRFCSIFPDVDVRLITVL